VLAGFDLIALNGKRLVPLDYDDFKAFELEPKLENSIGKTGFKRL